MIPRELINELNEFLCRRLVESGMYASFFVLLLDTGTMEMQFAGAGHPAALHLSTAENRMAWLESQTTLLGFEHPLPVHCPWRPAQSLQVTESCSTQTA